MRRIQTFNKYFSFTVLHKVAERLLVTVSSFSVFLQRNVGIHPELRMLHDPKHPGSGRKYEKLKTTWRLSPKIDDQYVLYLQGD
jgi:hypothetical protein